MDDLLGKMVKDKVTGIVGVAENRASYLYGCNRYCVQPQAKEDGTLPGSIMIDEPQLVAIEKHRVLMPASEPAQLIQLGAEVYDPIANRRGTATGRAVYLNGCSRILVEAKAWDDKKSLKWWVDEEQVSHVKTIFGKIKMNIKGRASKYTGGPARASSKR